MMFRASFVADPALSRVEPVRPSGPSPPDRGLGLSCPDSSDFADRAALAHNHSLRSAAVSLVPARSRAHPASQRLADYRRPEFDRIDRFSIDDIDLQPPSGRYSSPVGIAHRVAARAVD